MKPPLQEEHIADQIEDIAHPALSTKVIGHSRNISHLLKQYHSGRMHHAWMLEGTRGIGKATLAFQMAAHILRYSNPADAPLEFNTPTSGDIIQSKIAARAHPNLLHVSRAWDHKTKKFKTQVSVENVRNAIEFFGKSRAEEGWRVAIVDAVDEMNPSAANALLKLLEEPPENTVFFIICHSPGKVLPTIKSRCQKLPMHGLSSNEMLEVMAQLNLDLNYNDSDMELLTSLADGSVRQAITLAKQDGLKLYKEFSNATNMITNPDWVNIHKLADGVGRGKEDRYRLLLGFAENYIQARATGRSGEDKSLSMLDRWAKVWEKARQSISSAEEYNLDKKQVIINLFQDMGQASQKQSS